MEAVYKRKPLAGEVPDFTKSGYLGSIAITKQQWDYASDVGEKRRLFALEGDYQRAEKIPEKQKISDLKGAIGEIGLFAHFKRIAEENGLAFQHSELVQKEPDTSADLTIGDMKFDIKGSAGLVEGYTNRDDKRVLVNGRQHDKTYADYKGYFFVKSYANFQDIFFVKWEDVNGWNTDPGYPRNGGRYYWTEIPKVQ